MMIVRVFGKPHAREDIFAEGAVGFRDRSSPFISVIPDSVSFEQLDPMHFQVTLADGTIHKLDARWLGLTMIGYVHIDPTTQAVSWADEDEV